MPTGHLSQLPGLGPTQPRSWDPAGHVLHDAQVRSEVLVCSVDTYSPLVQIDNLLHSLSEVVEGALLSNLSASHTVRLAHTLSLDAVPRTISYSREALQVVKGSQYEFHWPTTVLKDPLSQGTQVPGLDAPQPFLYSPTGHAEQAVHVVMYSPGEDLYVPARQLMHRPTLELEKSTRCSPGPQGGMASQTEFHRAPVPDL